MFSVNCIYSKNKGIKTLCTNKAVKRSFCGLGPRLCVEDISMEVCSLRKSTAKPPKQPPAPFEKRMPGLDIPKKVIELAKNIGGLDASARLIALSDACSQALYNSSCEWEKMNSDMFISNCVDAITLGVKAKRAGFVPK